MIRDLGYDPMARVTVEEHSLIPNSGNANAPLPSVAPTPLLQAGQARSFERLKPAADGPLGNALARLSRQPPPPEPLNLWDMPELEKGQRPTGLVLRWLSHRA